MKVIQLSSKKYPGLVAIVDDHDYENLVQHKWFPFKGRKTFYAVANIRQSSGKVRSIKMHNMIMDVSSRMTPIDHKDRNGLNNQRTNIRSTSNTINRHNSGEVSSNKSGHKGVHWEKSRQKWQVQIKQKSKKTVKRFDDFKEACLFQERIVSQIITG